MFVLHLNIINLKTYHIMKTKIEIKSVFGKLLFEYESEDNSLVKTIEEANLRGADLYGANLRGANLSEANLYGANLRGANLSEADLYGANLSGANLLGADLSEADLYGANLSGADLYGANLRGADLYGANLRGAGLYEANLSGAKNIEAKNIEACNLPIFCKWTHSVIGDNIQIGCKTKSIEEWQKFFDSNEEYSTPRNSEDFKRIQAVFESYKAYLNHLKS